MSGAEHNQSVGGKVHPASREILPNDPLEMTGFQVPGDPQLMLRLLVEEYARIGCDAQAIMHLAQDPNYRGFHGLLRLYGEHALRRRIEQILSRTGVMRVTTIEEEPEPACLIQLETTFNNEREADHGKRLQLANRP